MRQVVLLCTANRKGPRPAPAIALYRSPLFYAGRRYAQRLRPDALYLLSAAYGLVAAARELPPYPETMSSLRPEDLGPWAEAILSDLAARTPLARTHVTLLGLDRFIVPLLPPLPHHTAPLRGMTLPEALHWLRASGQTG